MVIRVYQIRQNQLKTGISTIRETMVLRIVGHKFDNMGLPLYQIGHAGTVAT